MLARFLLVLITAITLVACGGNSVPLDSPIRYAEQIADGPTEHLARETVHAGPGYFCGWKFAVLLADEEQLTTRDPGLDFRTYAVESATSDFLLYEGNHPQEANAIIELGSDFPVLLAIHLSEGGDDARRGRS